MRTPTIVAEVNRIGLETPPDDVLFHMRPVSGHKLHVRCPVVIQDECRRLLKRPLPPGGK